MRQTYPANSQTCFAKTRLMIAYAVIGLSLTAQARTEPVTSAFHQMLRWNDCLQPFSDEESAYPAACVNLKVGAQLLLAEPMHGENFSSTYSAGYLGLHPAAHVSLHLGARKTELVGFGGNSSLEHKNLTITDSAFIQFGNAATSTWRFSYGQQDLPYGMNFQPLMKIYYHTVKTNKYWIFPKLVSKVTYDNLDDLQMELGYGTSEFPGNKPSPHQENATRHPDAISFRIHYDFTALEGSRLSGFWLSDSDTERRYGASYMNADPTGQKTVVEWQRKTDFYRGQQSDWQQNWRITYAGALRNQTRWRFEFEDERNTYRLTTLGGDIQLPDYGLFRIAGSVYASSTSTKKGYWFITSGVEIAL